MQDEQKRLLLSSDWEATSCFLLFPKDIIVAQILDEMLYSVRPCRLVICVVTSKAIPSKCCLISMSEMFQPNFDELRSLYRGGQLEVRGRVKETEANIGTRHE